MSNPGEPGQRPRQLTPPDTWMPPPSWPGQGGPGQSGPAARRPTAKWIHLSWLALTVAGVIVGGLTGFAIGRSSTQIGAAIKSAGAAAAAGPCTGASTTPGSASQLVRRLLPLPPGAARLKGQFTARVLSVDGYIRELYPSDPAEKSRLAARCFKVAVQLAWVEPSGQTVAIYLSQFGTAADARSYALSSQSGDLLDQANKLHSAVPGVADGLLIQNPTLDKYGNTLSRLIGDHGDVAIIIHLFESARLPARSVADSLLQRQSIRIGT
ncbi:MAG TPA: hypothetical protein VNF47_10985 [Streptosporangiaceae bacterium]|nr:hypothetical protein [Streptosporangiaceae bacterium]